MQEFMNWGSEGNSAQRRGGAKWEGTGYVRGDQSLLSYRGI